jgi:cytoskeletal protein CcmA (bactofilin family)
MLRSETLFGKREPNSNTPNSPLNASSTSTQPGSMSSAVKPGPAPAGMGPGGVGAAPAPAAPSPAPSEGGSKLIVGPKIKLTGGQITDCDTLVVEGTVEATMEAREIQIAEQGSFSGSAEIDVAHVRGTFDGNLTARQKLVIYSTGKVIGTVRYGKIVIEEGGELAGDTQVGSDSGRAGLSVAKAAI